MGSWRDQASPLAQSDLDALLNAALDFAQGQLQAHGEFYPFAMAIDTGGDGRMLAADLHPEAEQPDPADVLESSVAALQSQRDQLRAAAVAADVHLAQPDTDAIQVDLEHAEGQALTAFLPYTKKGEAVEYGPLGAQAGNRRIWVET